MTRTQEYEKLFASEPRLLADNLQIIACAGAGKTEFISWRIAFALRDGLAKAENIVAFTFTERAAEELKFRIRHHIRELLGKQPDIGDMYVGTIHSFCFKLLQEYVPRYRVFDVLDEGKQYSLLSSLRAELGIRELQEFLERKSVKPYGSTTQSWVLGSFQRSVDLVREYMGKVDKVSASKAFSEAYRAYEELLDSKQFLDFSGMMRIATKTLQEDDGIREQAQERYTHITVDEYQDINPIQERLISLLVGKKNNICVVGDDDQSIYQWRGADVQNIMTFPRRYDNVYVHKLPLNYRSTEPVVACANAVIKHNKKRLAKSMKAAGGKAEKGDIVKLVFDHQNDEVKFIVEKVKALIGTEYIESGKSARGLTYSDIAIFFRSVAYDASPYIEALRDAGIPVAVAGIGGLFETEEADIVFELFAFLGDFEKVWNADERESYVPEIDDIYARAKDTFAVGSRKEFTKYFEKLKNELPESRRVSLQGLYGQILVGLGLHLEEMHAENKGCLVVQPWTHQSGNLRLRVHAYVYNLSGHRAVLLVHCALR